MFSVAAHEHDHLVRLARDRGLDRGLTRKKRLVIVRLRRAMGGGTLGDAELRGAGLHPHLLLDESLEIFTRAAELGMAECIGAARTLGRDIIAVLVDEALAHDDQAVFLALEHAGARPRRISPR